LLRNNTTQLLAESFQLTVDGHVFTFNVRSQLIEFLRGIAAEYKVHIFTASTRAYANALLDYLCKRLGNDDLFAGRWYREHCVYNEDNGIYDLSRLPLPLDRTVFVDNNPDLFVTNGILVNSFEDNCADHTLGLVAEFIAGKLDTAADVRTLLARLPPPGLHSILSRGGPAMVVMVVAAIPAGRKQLRNHSWWQAHGARFRLALAIALGQCVATTTVLALIALVRLHSSAATRLAASSDGGVLFGMPSTVAGGGSGGLLKTMVAHSLSSSAFQSGSSLVAVAIRSSTALSTVVVVETSQVNVVGSSLVTVTLRSTTSVKV
jgi:NLI interacting factor-like phosphatase